MKHDDSRKSTRSPVARTLSRITELSLSTHWFPLLVLGAVAACLRIWSLVEAAGGPLWTHYRLDAQVYDAAGRLIAGGDLVLGNQVYHISPLYCYFVGSLYSLFGVGPWPIRLVQMGLGVVAVLLLYDCARRMFDERWAWLVGILACLYGPFIFYEQLVLVATLATFLNVLLLWVAMVALQRPGRCLGLWLVVGAVWGLGMTARPNTLLLAPALALAAWWQNRRLGPGTWRSLAAAAALLVTGLVVTAPFTIRNWVVASDPVFLQDKGGLNFYVGNGPNANGAFMVPPELGSARNVLEQVQAFTRIAEDEEGKKLKPSAVDRHWYKKTFSHMADQPVAWLRLMLEKNWLFWSARELPNNYDYQFTRLHNRALGLPLVQFLIVAPFALLGTLFMLFGRRREEQLIALFNLILVGAVVLFFVLSRYRLPVIPGLLLATVPALQRLVSAGRRARWQALAVYIAALLAMLVIGLVPKLEKPLDDEYFKLGYAYHVQHKLPQAEQEYRTALQLNRDNASAAKNLASLLEQQGRFHDSAIQWKVVEEQARRNRWESRLRQATAQIQRLERIAPPQPPKQPE